MDNQTLKDVTAWFRTTDLAELEYRNGTGSVALRAQSAVPSFPSLPECQLVAVASPAVGLFRWSAPGSPRTAEKGADVAQGARLGLVEVGTRSEPVTAPCAGRIVSVAVEEGKAVEYGQPLFFLQPR